MAMQQMAAPVSDEPSTLTMVYPNPLDTSPLTVDLSRFEGSRNVQILLTDLSGNPVSSFKASGSQLQISRDNLPGKGVYLMKISNGKRVENVKLIIQ
jgi:hypothetical protein